MLPNQREIPDTPDGRYASQEELMQCQRMVIYWCMNCNKITFRDEYLNQRIPGKEHFSGVCYYCEDRLRETDRVGDSHDLAHSTTVFRLEGYNEKYHKKQVVAYFPRTFTKCGHTEYYPYHNGRIQYSAECSVCNHSPEKDPLIKCPEPMKKEEIKITRTLTVPTAADPAKPVVIGPATPVIPQDEKLDDEIIIPVHILPALQGQLLKYCVKENASPDSCINRAVAEFLIKWDKNRVKKP